MIFDEGAQLDGCAPPVPATPEEQSLELRPGLAHDFLWLDSLHATGFNRNFAELDHDRLLLW